jgi:hypothetical protein
MDKKSFPRLPHQKDKQIKVSAQNTRVFCLWSMVKSNEILKSDAQRTMTIVNDTATFFERK